MQQGGHTAITSLHVLPSIPSFQALYEIYIWISTFQSQYIRRALSEGCNLVVVEGLACSEDPKSDAVGSFILLVGPPKAVRSRGRNQTNSNPNQNQSPQRQSRRKTSLVLATAVEAEEGCHRGWFPSCRGFLAIGSGCTFCQGPCVCRCATAFPR